MNRKYFGELIAALRKEHTDAEGKVWTQARLAQETGLSQVLIGNIERGHKVSLEPDLLLKLATILELTNGERREFFMAAAAVDNEDIPLADPPEVVLKQLLQVLASIYLPAGIMDVFGEIVAVNAAFLKMYNIEISFFQNPTLNPATRFNSMRICFSDEFEKQRDMMGGFWPEFAHDAMFLFRTISLRYRYHAYFRYILPELKKFRMFRNYWDKVRYQEHRQYTDTTIFQAHIPEVGFIRSITSATTAITIQGELFLQTVVPLNALTARLFLEMAEQTTQQIYLLAPWPDKPLPK